MVLSGNVANDDIRVNLVESAKSAYPDAEIVDEMTLARGAPEGFGALAGFGISQLTDFTSGEASLSGMDLTVKGVAPSIDIYNAANTALAGDLPGGGKLAMADITPPTADPYTMSAVKSGAGITLDGFVPSNDVRSSLVAAAEAANPGKPVTDNLQLALGQPEGFGALAGFGISQLTGLTTGEMSLNNADLSVKGLAKDEATFNAINTALAGAIPGGGKVALEAIEKPAISPYVFSATEKEDGVTLEGYVPSEAVRAQLVETAGKTTNGTVTDNLKIGVGAPAGFTELADFGVSQLGQFSTGMASISDTDLSVQGTALSPEAYDTATNALSGSVPGDGQVILADITRSTVSPYTFSASKDKGIIVLDGYVSSEAERSDAVTFATVTNAGDRVIDRLVVANGVPEGVNWGEANKLAIKEASQLLKGSASISNNAYTVEGMASSNANYDGIKAEANDGLPAGLTLAKEDVRRPVIDPYVWSFTNMEDGEPTLSGYVPETEFLDANKQQIEARLGSGKAIANQAQIGAGAPANLDAAASVGIQAVSRLLNGKAEIEGTNLMVSGEALSQNAAVQIRVGVENGVPPGFIGKHNITVREVASLPEVKPDECQTLLTSDLKNNTIRFETDKSLIKPDSYGLLDRLAFTVKRCPTATVEVEGHTDSDGSDSYNQALSEDRANAVRSYLVRSGIFVGRLKAVGYGEKNPIADNSTEEGKSQNRRIEFTVVR